MLCLTKIKRSYVIEHVMPSDLDDKDIKHGLYLKEKMIQDITDDYVRSNFPNWKQIERNYRKNGLVDICDKLSCGEMTQNDIVKPKAVRTEVWMRYKKFDTTIRNNISNILGYYYNGKFYEDPEHNNEISVFTDKIYIDISNHLGQPYIWDNSLNKYVEDYSRYNVYDFDVMSGYSDWIKSDSNSEFELSFSLKNPELNLNDIMVQFQIAIIGENAIRYYPYQDMSHYSGFSFVQDELKVYDPQVWRRKTSTFCLIDPIENQEEYYRLFFKNYKGYYDLDKELPFLDDYTEWISANYPNEKEVRTIQTDPFRLKYVSNDSRGTDCTLVAKQWIKTNYKSELMNLCMFKLKIKNTKDVDPGV